MSRQAMRSIPVVFPMSTLIPLLFLFLFPLLLLLSPTTTTTADAAGRHGPLVGGWMPIKDLKDPYVRQIADFAVSEHNKQINGAKLTLAGIVSGQSQVVSGTNYRLVVEAKDGATGAVSRYEAVVWDKPWEKFRQLTSFTPVKA